LSLRNGGFATASAAEMGFKPAGDNSKKAAPHPSAFRRGIGLHRPRNEALLFCDRALGFDFWVAGENTRVFQISGKSAWRLGTISQMCRQPAACRTAMEVFESMVMPTDFKGRRFAMGSIVRVRLEEFSDEQMFEFGASHALRLDTNQADRIA
jgi:hypothetical protein